MLKHQEITEPDTSEVIRLAHQMYERDQAEQERRSSLMAAAEEVGIPSEYLAKATAQLKLRQAQQPMRVPVQVIQQRRTTFLLTTIGLVTGILMLFALSYLGLEARAPVVAPPTVIQPEPAPVAPSIKGNH
jgi:hypothetical protein